MFRQNGRSLFHCSAELTDCQISVPAFRFSNIPGIQLSGIVAFRQNGGSQSRRYAGTWLCHYGRTPFQRSELQKDGRVGNETRAVTSHARHPDEAASARGATSTSRSEGNAGNLLQKRPFRQKGRRCQEIADRRFNVPAVTSCYCFADTMYRRTAVTMFHYFNEPLLRRSAGTPF